MTAGRWSLLRWIVDLALLTAALFLSNWAKWTLPLGQTPDPGTRFVTPLILALLLATWSVFGRSTALYHPRSATSLGQEIQRTAITLALTLITVAGLFLFLKYSKIGLSIRAVKGNAAAAQAVGIRVDHVYMITFGLVGLLSGLSGALLTPIYRVFPTVGAL